MGSGCSEPMESGLEGMEEPPVATAPLMPETASLTGLWRLAGPGGDCALTLSDQDRPMAPDSPGAAMLQATTACRGLESVRGWRPAPLGLELADADGLAVVTFEQTGPAEYRSINQAWRLYRP